MVRKSISSLKNIWKPLVAVTFWGGSFIATKIALRELEPLAIIFLRQLLGIFLLTSLAIKNRKSFSISSKDFFWILLLSLIATFHLWIQVTGLQYTTATNTGWIVGITPVFMALMGLIFFKEKISALQTLGIIIAFIGLLLLISNGDLATVGLLSNKGDFLVLASAFTWSVYSIVGKRITFHYPPMMTILYLFVIMSLFISPFVISEENLSAIISLSISVWTAILFLGLLCSGIAYVLWASALKEMTASKVGAFLYIEPFVTVFTAWIVLNEKISLLTFLSGIIIIIGVTLVNRK